MAKAAKRPAGAWTYVLTADRDLPENERTRFVLRPLTGPERELAVDDVTRREVMLDGSVQTISRMRTVARQLALTHIESIENFPAGQTKPWPNGKSDPSERMAYLDLLTDDDVFEIGNEIYLRSTLGPEEAKQVEGS